MKNDMNYEIKNSFIKVTIKNESYFIYFLNTPKLTSQIPELTTNTAKSNITKPWVMYEYCCNW